MFINHCKDSDLDGGFEFVSKIDNKFKRLMDIYSSTPKTVDALMKLELPSGVDVEIKV